MPSEPMSPQTGAEAVLTRTVTADDTARALGSGDLEVLATPRLLAWCEAATVAAVAAAIDPSRTTVGTRVELEHLRACLVGSTVEVRASLGHVDGRLLRFEVVATDPAGALLGRATVTRVVVDRDRFLARL
jgi:fluoroacetyl-CoA thioesterase